MIIREASFFDATRYTALLQINIFCRKPRIQTKNRKTLQQKSFKKTDKQRMKIHINKLSLKQIDKQKDKPTKNH